MDRGAHQPGLIAGVRETVLHAGRYHNHTTRPNPHPLTIQIYRTLSGDHIEDLIFMRVNVHGQGLFRQKAQQMTGKVLRLKQRHIGQRLFIVARHRGSIDDLKRRHGMASGRRRIERIMLNRNSSTANTLSRPAH